MLDPLDTREALFEAEGANAVRRRIIKTRMNTRKGPFDEPIEETCEEGFGHWTMGEPACASCSVSAECGCKTLHLVPHTVYVAPKRRKRVAKDLNPFKPEIMRWAFEMLKDAIKRKRSPVTVSLLSFEELDEEATSQAQGALISLAVVDTMHSGEDVDLKLLAHYWGVVEQIEGDEYAFIVHPKKLRDAIKAAGA